MREQSENVAMGAFGAGHFISIIVVVLLFSTKDVSLFLN
jgi:hypothetical protein